MEAEEAQAQVFAAAGGPRRDRLRPRQGPGDGRPEPALRHPAGAQRSDRADGGGARAAKAELERRQQLAIHIQAAERRRQAVYQRKSAEAEKLSAVLVARQREEARQQQQQQGEGVLNAIGNFIMAPMALAAGEMALAAGPPSQALPPPPLFVGGMPDAPSTRRRDMPLLNTDKARNQTAAVERAKRVAENAAIMGSIEAAKDEAAELEAAKAEAAKWRQSRTRTLSPR